MKFYTKVIKIELASANVVFNTISDFINSSDQKEFIEELNNCCSKREMKELADDYCLFLNKKDAIYGCDNVVGYGRISNWEKIIKQCQPAFFEVEFTSKV